ncbi:hypothetical protein [Natrinema marinum]|uniref:hypothetical protein n=1 Tax=Natrinema marinum TaxID=2961598 RepID=UPI0020C8C190|nr:hypothetical protein [Natrinema marinum]
MRKNTEMDDEVSSALPACPTCGRPVSLVTATGPAERIASPCGCPIAPGALEEP